MSKDDEKKEDEITLNQGVSELSLSDNIQDYHDDSSDEELETDTFKRYDFQRNIDQYIARSNIQGALENHFLNVVKAGLSQGKLSEKKGIPLLEEEKTEIRENAVLLSAMVMVVHCIGRAIPHASNISHSYYPEKKLLGKRKKPLSDIKKILTESLQLTISKLDPESSVKFITENKEEITKISDFFKQKPLLIMREARRFYEFKKSQNKTLFTFSEEFLKVFMVIENSLYLLCEGLFEEKSKVLKIPEQIDNNRVIEFVVIEFMQLTNSSSILHTNGKFKKGSANIKIAVQPILEQKNVANHLLSLCAIVSTSAKVNDDVRKFINNDIISACKQFFIDIETKEYKSKKLENNSTPKKEAKLSYSPKTPPSPASPLYDHKDRLSLDPFNFIHFLRETLIESFISNFTLEKRPTLPIVFELKNDGIVSFVRNTRLSNRAIRRQTLNNEYKMDFAFKFSRIWLCQPLRIVENLTINKYGTREDYVDMPFMPAKYDSYNNIVVFIDELRSLLNSKSSQKITDKEIALWIRQIYSNEDKLYMCDRLGYPSTIEYVIPEGFYDILKHSLWAVAVLLFHTECSRNRASYVCNQMFLDLLQFTDKFKWKELTILLPMAQTPIVEGGRYLNHQLFFPYLPFSSFYQGLEHKEYQGPENKDTGQKLFSLEVHIIKLWCKYIVKKPVGINEFIYIIHSFLKTRWYPGIGSLATHSIASNKVRVNDLLAQGEFKLKKAGSVDKLTENLGKKLQINN